MMKKTTGFTLTAMIAGLTFSALALGSDAEAGKAKSAQCVGCHGAAGKAMIPSYPNLAGQNKPYLIGALKAYKEKQRTGGQAVIMQGQASTLSDADIDNLAAYYSGLK